MNVAIVGMACRFAGAPDLATYWKNLVAGRSSLSDVPADRWDVSVFCDPDVSANDRVPTARGGYLNDPIGFDPIKYGIMPLAVEGGEPEQFLVLDAARSALDDAGMLSGVPKGVRTEVVIGRGNYFNRGNLTRLQHGRIVAQTLKILRDLHPDWTNSELEAVRNDLKSSLPPFEAGTIPGQITNATAGRIVDRLDLSGASYVVDAASASSLVAVDLATRALLDRRADLALAAGVYLQPDVDFPMVFHCLKALSRRGEARPFARSADGTLPGEGVGVLVLKRRDDAERDGDRVYAVIQGVGIASDGRASGLAAPSARGHARAIRSAYRRAGIDPASVDLIEGHGLGVPASDRAELRALNAVFPRSKHGKRTLGAVSGLIGHAMPAAGMAGLIKTALCLYHRLLPPTPHADEPHPLLSGDEATFALNPTARPWIHGDESHPRRAGVNAFGFAGINTHAILEEHAKSADGITRGCMNDWETEAILLGAPDRARWVELADALIAWLDTAENARVPLKDLAFTLNTGQGQFPFRVGLVVGSTADLSTRLKMLLARIANPTCRSVRDARGSYFWEESLSSPGRLAFLFPGEGSQYPGMLADLCPHFPEVRAVLDTSERIALEQGHRHRPSEQLFGASKEFEAGLWDVETAVNVVLSSQWALYQLLIRLGLRPDAVLGHSSGEFLALAAAGVVTSDRVFEDRLGDLATVLKRLEESGQVPTASLVAVAANRDRVADACREAGGRVEIAIDNCPHQVVIAGDEKDVADVSARLRSRGILLDALPFQRAYHTARFSRALTPIRAFFGDLMMRSPKMPVYSCATSAPMGQDVETVRRLAVDQWISPVNFRSTIEAMHTDGFRIFVEVGARGNLTGFVEDTLRGRPHFGVAANLARRSGLTQLNHLVASIYAQGVPVQVDHLYARRRPCRIDLAADFQVPTAGPHLVVGFPEMSLSEAIIDRLQTSRRIEFEPISNGVHNGNGSTHHGNGHALTNGHSQRLTQTQPPPVVNRAFPDAEIARQVGDEGSLLEYFRTMDLFLETQREVMEAYLGSRPSEEVIIFNEPPPVIPSQTHVLASSTQTSSQTNINSENDVRTLLLAEVSKRTGYPREMLDLDYDMEGDLGIDSIKRVEILGQMQSEGFLPEGMAMESLSRCRTLGQVVAVLEKGRNAQRSSTIQLPWPGEIERYLEGRELVAVRWLDRHDDPVAEQHTLGGRRLSRIDVDRLGLPVVPFTVMAEMLAQGATVLAPGMVVVGLQDVQANRWLTYGEEGPVALEVHAVREPGHNEIRVSIRNRGRAGLADEQTVAGVVIVADRREKGPIAEEFSLEDGGTCRFTALELYNDQWLFHGPMLQALTHVGASSPKGIEGTIKVLPRRDLFPARDWPTLHTDPIVLDTFTHLLGCWGLDKQAGEEGDVIFPLRMATLKIFGDDPAEGSAIACQIKIVEISRHRIKVNATLVGPDGRVWMSIDGWEDWRFYWPGRYRDVLRSPDRIMLGDMVEPSRSGLCAVLIEPPGDMLKPVWGDVMEWCLLSPAERVLNQTDHRIDPARTWAKIAAKEAARRIMLDRGETPVYPADLEIRDTIDGRWHLYSRIDFERNDLPSVAFAAAEGVAIAIASVDPDVKIGLAIERVEGIDERESRRKLARKAAGLKSIATILEENWESGEILLQGTETSEILCGTARRGDLVWAWTMQGQGVSI